MFHQISTPFIFLRKEWLRTCVSRKSGRSGRGWRSWNNCGRRTKNWRTSSRPCSLQTPPRIRPQTQAWPRTRGLTERSVHMNPSRTMDVVSITEDTDILGTSKTRYKSRKRKERRVWWTEAGCLICDLIAGIFHCAPNHNRNEQAATAPMVLNTSSSFSPSSPYGFFLFRGCHSESLLSILTYVLYPLLHHLPARPPSLHPYNGSEHIIKIIIIIMRSFLTDLVLLIASIQPRDTLWLFLLYIGIKGIHLNSRPGCNVLLRACVYVAVTPNSYDYLPARCRNFVNSSLAKGLSSLCPTW